MLRRDSHKTGKIIAAFICFVTCLGILKGNAQVLNSLQSSLNAYQKVNLHEKIYVHTNKSTYVSGEILWFKIYNTDGGTNKVLDLSKVVYVELLDNNHVPVQQAKIAMSNGTGNGSFYLPFSLNNGNYQLRAYTNWMKNFDADYFFQQQIVIINPVKVPDNKPVSSTAAYDVQFFPEGGHLVKGMNSKVAFKVTGSDGKGVTCSGVIIGQQNDTIARFNSLKFGIGSFSFTPAGNVKYKAVINAGNKPVVKELPQVSESGYVMQATDHGDNLEISVQNSDTQLAEAVYLVVHNHHQAEAAESVNIVNGNGHLTISKSKLDEGMSYVTLFDDQKRPICERLIFKRPARKLVINTNMDGQAYNTRKKVSLNIATNDLNSHALPANLSVSVYQMDSLQKNEGTHISGYLWLSADLKGAY